jgi:hypothetical protein
MNGIEELNYYRQTMYFLNIKYVIENSIRTFMDLISRTS